MDMGAPRSVRKGSVAQAPVAIGMLLILCACAVLPGSPPPATIPVTQPATPTLISCDAMTPVADHGSILPVFTPTYACELEHVARHVDFCMVHASPELSYPCSQTESVQETTIGKSERSLLIKRDYHLSGGCWHGITADRRSLRACDSASGKSTTLAEDAKGDPLLSPDATAFAFVATAPDDPFTTRLFRVRMDGSELIRLDTKPFPQEQSLAAVIRRWSQDGAWLEISLWDGYEGGHHRYRLRTDGSGAYEALP